MKKIEIRCEDKKEVKQNKADNADAQCFIINTHAHTPSLVLNYGDKANFESIIQQCN